MCRWLSGVVGVLALAGVARADKPPAVPKPLDPLVRLLASSDDVALQRDVLRGMCEALAGRRSVTAPAGWAAAYTKLAASKDDEVRRKALALAVLFGDPRALAALRKTAADAKADVRERREALQTLIDKRPADLPPLLRELLKDKAMRGPALRGLAAYDEATTPAVVLKIYATLNDAEKADAVSTLASRPAYALALLDAVEKGTVARTDVSPFVARQLLALKD